MDSSQPPAEKYSQKSEVHHSRQRVHVDRALPNLQQAPEIIANAFAAYYAEMYRKQMQGKYAEMKSDAEWQAISNVLGALISVNVLKGIEGN